MIKIRNWSKFQHFKNKSSMVWFKVYGRDIINDPDWHDLDSDQKATLFELFCLASERNGELPEMRKICFRLHKDEQFISEMIKSLLAWFDSDLEDSIYDVYTENAREKKREEENIYTLDGFNEFWLAYPSTRKVGKKPCQDKWIKKGLSKFKDKIIDHVKTMSDSKQWREGYSPNPLTYINQERFNDPIEESFNPFAGAK